MSHDPARVVLVGSHRGGVDLSPVLDDLGVGDRLALITAGWQEWEEDQGRLKVGTGREVVNLLLYARAEAVWGEDPELAEGHRAMQDRIRLLRRVYNLRLAHAMDAWIQLERLPGDPLVLDAERASALDAVRRLDRHHMQRLREIRMAYHDRFDPLMRDTVARRRQAIIDDLEGTEAVVVAGGHVPVLLNRLRLFGLDRLLGGRTVVAVGGGAMALGQEVVLFHDSPPWGPGHAEVGEVGPGLYPGVVPLPDPAVRLRLDDPGRVSRMARRFAPDSCLLLEPGTRAEWTGEWTTAGARRLGFAGQPEEWDGRAAPTLEGPWPSRN